jgi:hypothetical protein
MSPEEGIAMCNPITTKNPDILLTKGVHEGYEWEVTSNRMGYRCGYVRVPQGHSWHGKGYDDVRTADDGWPDVHGGLTFAEADTDCGKGGEDNAWWLGFDCAHGGDAPDPDLPGYHPRMSFMGDAIRSTEYVAEECRKLADQAAAAAA